MKTLLIGGARSGKSALAQRWAQERGGSVRVVVTATASDTEMATRIAAHRRDRPAHWSVREAPAQLGQALREETAAALAARPHECLLIDCLTLWVANCLWPASTPMVAAEPAIEGWQRERADFLAALAACAADVIVVSNEVGMGIVPADPGARLFRDEQGWINQAVAAACEEVFVVFGGLPLRLKPV